MAGLKSDKDVGQLALAVVKRRRAFSGASVSQGEHDSSDGSAYNKDRIEVRNGYPIRYKCLDAVEGQVDADWMQVFFKYEMVVSKDSGMAENLRALEWSILWSIVQEIGLNRCDFSKQSAVFENSMAKVANQGGNRLRRLQTNVQSAGAPPSFILSLSSDGEDTMDRDAGSCQYTKSVESSAVCIPVKGSMQLLYTGNQTELVEEFLLEEVRMAMSSTLVLVKDVRGVTFVGTELPAAAADTTLVGNRGSAASSSGLLVSVSIGLVAVIVLSILVGIALSRSKRRAAQVKGQAGKEIEAHDLDEVPTTSTDSSESKPQRTGVVQLPQASDDPWEPLQPAMDVEHDGVIYSVQPVVPPSSVYLASTRPRKRKKGGMRRKKSLRERASAAPFGIESIPEADGDFNSALYDLESPDSECTASSDDEDDDQLVASHTATLPNTSPRHSPLIFYSTSTSPTNVEVEW